MTDEQIQALEALYMAARGRYDTLVDRSKVEGSIKESTLDELRKQGVIRIVGRGLFMLTPHGVDRAIENRHTPPADT